MNKNYIRQIDIINNYKNIFPYNLPLYKSNATIRLEKPITFIVGENGTGKSTLLEGLANVIGFNPYGGNSNHFYNNNVEKNIEDIIKLTWSIKTKKGFFFRAESFFNFSEYIDKLIDEDNSLKFAYGGKKLNHQSHGESFLSIFANKFKDGIFILDEPEAALSAERQFTLIAILNELTTNYNAQFIIATHSPILITTPNSEIFEIENNKFVKKNYTETKQFQLYKSFINAPERYINFITKEDE